MNIAVVGAGLTGCLAALHAARRGAQVTLFESEARLGGIVRDVEVQGQRFYNGCQYFRHGALDALGLSQGLEVFPHEYGSLTLLGNQQARLLDDCAQPALDGQAELNPQAVLDGTALQRLSAYGPHADRLITWASGFGKLDELDQRCVLPMQLSRIFYPEDAELKVKKVADAKADALIALPRRIRQPCSQAEPAMLPPDGFDPFLSQLEETLKEAGVRLQMNSPVKLMDDSPGLRLYSRGQEQVFDQVVWASNPTALLQRVCGIRLKTPPIAMMLWVGQFKKSVKAPCPVPLPYYWQVFDDASPVIRVYVYRLQGHLRFSVEAFERPGVDAQHTLAQVFQRLGLPSEFELVASLAQLRHVNFSTTELAAMQASTPSLLARGIIPGGWCHYGREEKVASMKRCLDQVLP